MSLFSLSHHRKKGTQPRPSEPSLHDYDLPIICKQRNGTRPPNGWNTTQGLALSTALTLQKVAHVLNTEIHPQVVLKPVTSLMVRFSSPQLE